MTTRPPSAEQSPRVAEAEAALMLTESLMLTLIEAEILTVDQVREAIEIVIETKHGSAADGEHPAISRAAIQTLHQLSASVAAAASRSRLHPTKSRKAPPRARTPT